MTKPRKSIHRELFGIIGHVPDASAILREWNAAFRKMGMDASMDVYPTTAENLPERLSEMFHFDRRGYVVGENLSKKIIPLLDRITSAARRRGVTFVWNEKGVLKGVQRKKDPGNARGPLGLLDSSAAHDVDGNATYLGNARKSSGAVNLP
ncbi:MAG: hypothetical protein PHX87_04640 [Candidatus Peribacteraceae bacterium]|nr:hypothetical protein [Candidatus Peribacteraceae bacterium]MDD5742685.1 hypothetical protein [Candidatus Peribacteraceae bacterium]